MNLKEHFLSIIDFLSPYENIWANEILLIHPKLEEFYPPSWLDELETITDQQQLLELEQKKYEHIIKDESLRSFYAKSLGLTDFETYSPKEKLPENRYTFLYTIPKKQHELRLLAPLIHEEMQKSNLKRVVDIGGGVGLLAQTISNTYLYPVTSFDLDAKMQATGMERNKKNTPKSDHLVQFKNLKISGAQDLADHFEKDDLTVGLHTCGPLANFQIEASVNKQVTKLISLGCCYHKLKIDEFKISKFAKEHCPFNLKQFALTLASRAHKKFDLEDIVLKNKVKHYRYTIHFIFEEFFNEHDNLTLGNSDTKLYDAPFSEYAMEQFKKLKRSSPLAIDELDQYYQSPKNQKRLRRMLAAGLIRDSLSKALEVAILLDRAIYLEEHNYQTKIVSIFDEHISPRHLGIISEKANE